MHFSKILYYLSLLSTGIIFIHARPLTSRDANDTTTAPTSDSTAELLAVEALNILSAMAGVTQLLQTLLTTGLENPSLFDSLNSTITTVGSQFALIDSQLELQTIIWSDVLGFGTNAFNDQCVFGISTDLSEIAYRALLVYIAGAVSGGIHGYTTLAFSDLNLTLSKNTISAMLGAMSALANVQTLANEMLFGIQFGLVNDFLAPVSTPFETVTSLTPFLGNCSIVDFTNQSASFDGIPQVTLIGSNPGDGSSISLTAPFEFASGTELQIDTTQVRNSDKCNSNGTLFCQVMAIQDATDFVSPGAVTVMPSFNCTLPEFRADGVTYLYVTSDDFPLPTSFEDRLSMSTDNICAGPTYIYVQSNP